MSIAGSDVFDYAVSSSSPHPSLAVVLQQQTMRFEPKYTLFFNWKRKSCGFFTCLS